MNQCGCSRAIEILTGGASLTAKCRVPTVSLTQKVHNVDVALKALKASAAGSPPGNVAAKDIVQVCSLVDGFVF